MKDIIENLRNQAAEITRSAENAALNSIRERFDHANKEGADNFQAYAIKLLGKAEGLEMAANHLEINLAFSDPSHPCQQKKQKKNRTT